MKVFSVSDLHLSGDNEKPMQVFGQGWENHFEKICAEWRKKVCGEDVVLIAGDICWAMKLNEAAKDLARLKGLPGKKVFVRGNHDYWWQGIGKVRRAAPDDTFYFIANDCVKFGNLIICGSRGWVCPGYIDYGERDEKLYLREVARLGLALDEADKVRAEGDRLIVMTHFPPFSLKCRDNLFTRMFGARGAEKVVFGHIHGETYFPLRTEIDGVEYILTSCDKIGFSPLRII